MVKEKSNKTVSKIKSLLYKKIQKSEDINEFFESQIKKRFS